jgi:hypothetical protein
VSIAAVSVLLLVLVCVEISAQLPPSFDVWKHEDLDKNGVFDNWDRDPSLEGWDFTVEDSGGLFAQGSTDENGNVKFPGISCCETYTICEVLKPGWTNSAPGAAGCMVVTVPENQNGPIELVFLNYRSAVGGATEPASRYALLAPWLALGALILCIGVAVTARRRQASAA